jgi:gentisate 1,2-dioxygenase
MAPYSYRNESSAVHARLVYSSVPLLEQIGVAHMLDHPELDFLSYATPRERTGVDPLADEVVQLKSPAATLRSYEALVNPDLGDQRPTLWTWEEAHAWLNPQADLGQAYTGRPVAVLVHSANARVLGTTPTLSAMYGTMPPNFRMTPHRHSAASIVYHFGGGGHSVVGGRRFEWKAGDLMWGAPGMAIHFHVSGDEQDLALIVQDNALQLAMDNEFWQENLSDPPILIGSHDGYRTNRGELQGAS